MKEAGSKQGNNLTILEKLDVLVDSTKNISSLTDAATKRSIISKQERETIVSLHYGLHNHPVTKDNLQLSLPCIYILLNFLITNI